MGIINEYIGLDDRKSELEFRQILVPNREIAKHLGWGWGETFERLEKSLAE